MAAVVVFLGMITMVADSDLYSVMYDQFRLASAHVFIQLYSTYCCRIKTTHKRMVIQSHNKCSR